MSIKVIVGMSGGVDSSVVAYLLSKKGYEVIGVWLKMHDDAADENAEADARKVAERLGIPFYTEDCRERFDEAVVKHFAGQYRKGLTPNPCSVCNPLVKWERLLAKADELGAEFIATGHYASVCMTREARATLKTADSEKDQTYMLYGLSQEQLNRTFMPLGNYTKDEVRELARQIGLEVSDKPDSQDICFIPDHDHAAFLERYTGEAEEEGNFVSESGEILGRHKGISHYTIGQRKGLGIAFGVPMFVKAIRPEKKEVVLSQEEALFTESLIASDVKCMGVEKFAEESKVIARIRYAHKGESCTLYPVKKEGTDEYEDKIRVVFDRPVRAVTPGQAVVFYDRDGYVMGGGIIQREESSEKE